MAIENGVQNAELGYILDPAFQIENLNGKPVVGGYICIYEAGTDNKYISYENFDGAQNPFKIPLKADGRAVILGDPSLTYDVYFYDSYGNQLFSRLNVQCNVPGNISIKGADTRINNTDGTLDISLQTLGNNVRQYTINTHNKVLDVQSPLYFVENSETATVIGFSGDGYVTEDKFEYDDNYNITGYDGSAFASNGKTYSAGTNIDITDNIISVTGLPDSADIENAVTSAVEEVENKFEYNENNYITAYNNSAFAGTNYSAGDYVNIENDTISVTGLQPSGDYATHDDLTAYQPSGDYATKTELESATSGKMDVTGMTAYQPTGDYATHDDLTAYQPAGDYYSASNPSGFITNDAITGLQPSGDYATHDDLTAYATTALVSSVSAELYSAFSGLSGDYELVAGSGVELVDDPTAKTTTINVTAEGTPVTAIEQMIESATSGLQPSGDYATTAQVADKLDTTAFSDVSGTFLTAHQDLSDYATTAELANKLDTTAFSDVSGTFLTAHQDISNKLDTTAFSDVSGSFLTAVPDTYLQNSDLTIVDNKITEISGVPLSAGDELPESVSAATDYVTATSADINATIDNVSANSGTWGGSALPISAGPGIKFEMVDNTLVASTSGYVWQSALLFHTDSPVTQTTYTLSDDCNNYDKLEVDFYDINGWRTQMDCSIPTNLAASGTRGGYFSVVPASTATGANVWFKAFNWTAANTTWSCFCSEIAAQGGSTTQTVNANQPENPPKVVNIIGWKRVGGN